LLGDMVCRVPEPAQETVGKERASEREREREREIDGGMRRIVDVVGCRR
jgi:hypothetical protein